MSKHNSLEKCPACGVYPGECHHVGCDVERCSACGGQRIQCCCDDHDPAFSRWTGIWPGKAEARYLGIKDLNDILEPEQGYGGASLGDILFIKPPQRTEQKFEDEPVKEEKQPEEPKEVGKTSKLPKLWDI